MSKKRRREILKIGPTAAGVALFPSVTAARKDSDSREKEAEIQVEEISTVAESDTVVVDQITVKNGESKDHYLSKFDKESGKVWMTEPENNEKRLPKADVKAAASSPGEIRISSASSEEIVKRSTYSKTRLSACDVNNSITHIKDKVSADFHDELDELGASAVIGALSQIISASSLGGAASAALTAAVTGVIGGAALLTDTTEITVGYKDFDKSLRIHTQAMHYEMFAFEYDADYSDMRAIPNVSHVH